MKIIGYNSSHETALAQYDTETKKIDFCYEEERFRRQKYWTPNYPQDQLLCIERMAIPKPDAFIGASFDRRSMPIVFDFDSLRYNRTAQQSILDFCKEGQMTMERVDQLFENHKEFIQDKDWNLFKEEQQAGRYLETSKDDELHGRVADQLDMDEFHYEIEHHLYHAECGYYFSEWNQKENAIAIVMDGGGCHKYAEEYPQFQEAETIFLLQPNEVPKRQYSRMSNCRWIEDVGKNLPTMPLGQIITAPEDFKTIDGCEVVFSSYPSQGMNFSALSLFFGFDKSGRAAGKVMGAASYPTSNKFNFLLPEFSQMIFSPGPLIYKLRQGLKNYTSDDYLLLTGDPALIGVACSIVSDITNGKYNILKWDKQERKYYPIEINLYEKGEIDDN